MNILKKLFFKQKTQNIETPTHYIDILLAWFNKENSDIETFEKEYYLPIIKELQEKDHFAKHYFEAYPKEAKERYWSIISFRYLVTFFTNDHYLHCILDLYQKKELPYDFSENLFSYSLFNCVENVKLKKLDEGIPIANFFYYINFEKNKGYSTEKIIYDISELKSSNIDLFFQFMEQIRDISMERLPEKPFMHYSFLSQEKDTEQLLTKEHQQKLDNLLKQSIEDYNKHFSIKLEKEIFDLVYKIGDLIDSHQKGRKKIPTEVLSLIQEKLNSNEQKLSFIKNFIYLSKYNSSTAYFFNECKGLLSHISQDLIVDKNTLEELFNKAKELSYPTVFNDVLVPLAKKIENEILFRDSLFIKLEDEMMKRKNPLPNETAFNINTQIIKSQKTKAKTENEKLELNYSEHIYSGIYSNFTSEKNNNHPQISKLVEYLNLFFPCSLKSIAKFYTETGYFFTLNIENESFGISYNVEEDINELLRQKDIPYRICEFYLYHEQDIVFSYSFFSKSELAICYNTLNDSKNIFDSDEKLKNTIDRHLRNIQIIYHSLESQAPLYFWDYVEKYSNKIIQKQDFENSVEWQWLRVNYIDNIVQNKKGWYELLDFIIPVKQGKKPQKNFITTLEKLVENIGYDTYFKELQQISDKMPKDDIWWNNESAKELSKSLMVSCAFLKVSHNGISILKHLAELYYGKVHGEGARSASLGNFALDCLVKIHSEEAFSALVLMRNKTKYNVFLKALDKYIKAFISESNMDEYELADKGIHDYGFDQNFEKKYIVEDYTLTLRFANGKLIKEWKDKNGDNIKSIPKEISDSQHELLKEINLDIKSIQTMFKDLKHRIPTYWTEERVWKFSFWKKYILNNPLINANIQNLIWNNESQNTDFIVIGNSLLNYDNQEIEINDDALISLWHSVTSDKENIAKWQDYLWKFNIIQPEKQVYRENYHLSENELANTTTDFFAHHFLEVNKLMAIANTRAWKFSYSHEGVSWPRKYLKKQNLTVHLKTDYNRNDFAIPTKELIFTKNDTTKIDDYPLVLEPITLGEIPKVLLSEVFRDVDLFIATTSICNNPTSINERQEFRNYYQSYEKSLFSENATSKVRKMILEQLAKYLDWPVLGFDKNYIIIKGKKNDYKINLSSGLVQIKDTSKYLNIQPNSTSLKRSKKVRLPIEDDETLLVIISKILFIINDEIPD